MTGQGQSKALMWTGIGLCVAGAAGLVVGGVLDVDAADPWASVAGGAAGLVGLALTVYALFAERQGATGSSVAAGGVRSVAAGGNIGVAVTGDRAAAPASPPPPSPPSPAVPSAPGTPPPPRGSTASGDRSIAAGGDIGSASTGDGA